MRKPTAVSFPARLFLLAWAIAFTAWNSFAQTATPKIEFTFVPAYASFANLSGRVINASRADSAVVVFIYVNGSWYSKPTCSAQVTQINSDGTWTTDITTGGADNLATRITALLVPLNYNEPCVNGAGAIPFTVLSKAKATVTTRRFDPNAPHLTFSGYEWIVKNSTAPVGPGPNLFSSNTNNVWLDESGRLHLKITNRDGKWQCAEVISVRSFGYGFYRFYLDTVVDQLDRNVVWGLFTYSDDPQFAHREIDFEFSRWGNATDSNNAQYVVQPWDLPNHRLRYRVSPLLAQTTYQFKWEPNLVTFRSFRKHSLASTDTIGFWTFSGTGVPPPGDENVHINLWLDAARPPSNAREVEVIVNRFEYLPLSAPQAARIVESRFLAEAGPFRVTINAELDRRYELQSSSDFQNWSGVDTELATQASVILEDANVPATRRFYRVVTLP
ncbi:MAG: glycoside hydrolase family 16 protein [Verrucomicrobiota bacterium]|jgi:hypothetical protein